MQQKENRTKGNRTEPERSSVDSVDLCYNLTCTEEPVRDQQNFTQSATHPVEHYKQEQNQKSRIKHNSALITKVLMRQNLTKL